MECYKLHNATCHQTTCDVINEVKLFLTVYRSIYIILSHIFDVIQSDIVLQSVQIIMACVIVNIGIYCTIVLS